MAVQIFLLLIRNSKVKHHGNQSRLTPVIEREPETLEDRHTDKILNSRTKTKTSLRLGNITKT